MLISLYQRGLKRKLECKETVVLRLKFMQN